jgi:AraC-like DNA-binding protein
MLVTHRPSGPLACCVDMIWFVSREALPHSRERSLPTGRADLVIPLLQDSVVRYDSVDAVEARHLRGGVVSGAHDRFAVRGMGGASSVIGVHFKAGGAAPLLGGALGELRNRTVLLDELWGPMARELRERLQSAPQVAHKLQMVEEALRSRLRSAPPADTMVAWAVRALAADPAAARIEAVQRASGCTAQQFIRRFEAAVGLPPKRYARVLRFNALLPRLVRVGPIDWAEAAVAGGYFDQSHLIHEFKRLAGVTPASYAPVHASQPTHVAIADAPDRGSAARKNLQYADRRGG